MTDKARHIPVMLQEVEALLGLHAGAVAVDGTLGLGGHAAMMAARIGVQGRLIGIDQDAAAINIARAGLSGFQGRLNIVKSNFSRLDEVLAELGAGAVDAIFLIWVFQAFNWTNQNGGSVFAMMGRLICAWMLRRQHQRKISLTDIPRKNWRT